MPQLSKVKYPIDSQVTQETQINKIIDQHQLSQVDHLRHQAGE